MYPQPSQSVNSHGDNPTSYANAVSNRIDDPTQYARSGVQKYEAIVVENRLPSDGNKIRFYISELLPLADGHLRDNPQDMKRQFQDAQGRSHVARGKHNNNFTAEYFSTDTFRKTAPDVRRGERIYVWRKGVTDYWYWEPFNGDSMSKRRLETVIQSVNADKPKGGDATSHDGSTATGNTYFQEMSSQNKTYTVRTSKANGEVAAYTFQINAGGGAIILCDDAGNHIELDTKAQKIWLRNSAQTMVSLERNNIDIKCNEHLTANVGGNVTIKVGGNANIEVGGSTRLKSNGTTIDSDVVITKNVQIKGSLNVAGATSMGGGGTATGTLSVQGNLTSTSTNFPGTNNINGYRRS